MKIISEPWAAQPLVEIVNPSNMKSTRWNRFKTAVWNFILPPHIQLRLSKENHE